MAPRIRPLDNACCRFEVYGRAGPRTGVPRPLLMLVTFVTLVMLVTFTAL
jgi:hypothetical protein